MIKFTIIKSEYTLVSSELVGYCLFLLPVIHSGKTNNCDSNEIVLEKKVYQNDKANTCS